MRRSDQNIILLTSGGLGSNIYIQDKDTGECLTINISDEILSSFGNSVVYDGVIYLYHYDESNQLKVLSIELSTGNIVNELALDNDAVVKIINNLLFVQYFSSPLTIYNNNTFELIDELQIDNIPIEVSGIYEIDSSSDNIIINFVLASPSASPISPAIYDISTFEIIKGGSQLYFDISDNLIDEADIGSPPTIYDTDVQSEIIVLSFRDISGNYNLLYSNFDADILKIIPLNGEPTEVFIH